MMKSSRVMFVCAALTVVSALPAAAGQTDCGEGATQTAAVYTIQTPEQVAAVPSRVEPSVVAPPPAPVETSPLVTQSAQVAAPVPAPTVVESPAMPKIDPVVTRYADLLAQRIKIGADGLARFDYAGADTDGDLVDIKAYTDYLAALKPDAMIAADASAYWANLYNALTLKVVLENYPVKSIKKIKSGAFSPGPWKRDAVTVQGETLSLDNIEHDILREKYPSPYVHYMVNCASVGCPNLLPKLWDGATLEVDRKAAADAYINSPRGAVVDSNKLTVSSIYDWFEEDFGGNKAGVIAHLSNHATGDLAAAIQNGAKISGYDYDWSLNE